MTLLSHYTGRAGLEGIAQSKTLWATDFIDLKDKNELLFGYVEMSKRGMRAALEEIDKPLKPGQRKELDWVEASEVLYEHYRAGFEGSAGSEHLFVTSFAKARDQDEEDRGILTIWERYCRDGGYCLQYDRDEIRHLLGLEASHRHYGVIDLAEVHYGVNESDAEFVELNFQMKQRFLAQVHEARVKLGLQPQYDRIWPMSVLATRFLAYCAKHKDPFYKDEREVRIMAVPAKEAIGRPFEGLKQIKPVKTMTDGRRYIDIGANWSFKLEPRRVIVGPKAQPDIAAIVGLFNRRAEIIRPVFPIRNV